MTERLKGHRWAASNVSWSRANGARKFLVALMLYVLLTTSL
jgi:hypothetical protein